MRPHLSLSLAFLTLALGMNAVLAGTPTPTTAPSATSPPATPPVARTGNTVEDLFGVKVADPYRWMEGNDNPELAEWFRGQGAYTRAYLDRIPGRARSCSRASVSWA